MFLSFIVDGLNLIFDESPLVAKVKLGSFHSYAFTVTLLPFGLPFFPSLICLQVARCTQEKEEEQPVFGEEYVW